MKIKIRDVRKEISYIQNNYSDDDHDHDSLSASDIDYNEYEKSYHGTLQHKIQELEDDDHWLKFQDIEDRLDNLEYYH